MKDKATTLIAVVLSMLLSLVSFSSPAQSQTRSRVIADTGVVTLAPNQVLRVTGDWNGDGPNAIQFRQLGYTAAGCDGSVCKHTVTSQTTSGPVTLMPGEAASIHIASYGFGVSALVLTDG